MSYTEWNKMRNAMWFLIALFTVLILLDSCGQTQQKPASETIAQKTFASPEEAGTALLAAAKSADQRSLLEIFGPDSKNILFTGDAVKDQNNLKGFVDSYEKMHRWRAIKAGGEILYTGADNSPFPIPLDRSSSGQWSFDTSAGRDEILARRIGKGELTAIAACGAAAQAENQFFSKLKQYTQRFVSQEGKQDGLYWPSASGQPESPLGPVGDFAKSLGYTSAGEKPQPFNGYFFRILTKQGSAAKGDAKDYMVDGKMTGGFAILAYPAQYRDTGIMTFIVGKDGVVYQKDLGEQTTSQSASMTEYNPGEGWTPAL
jgi:Protein of unknown function (DUF2950)